MIATLFATLLLFSQDAAPTATFSNPQLNFTFTHPKAWSVATNKKSVSKIVVPIPDSQEKATIEVYAAAFQLEPERWLALQRTLAETKNDEIVRQWTEDLLGVPLLLTQTKSLDTEVLQGLLYSATERKFLFRLEAPASVFPQALAEWRSVWPSFRTVDGSLPTKEDPDRVPATNDSGKATISRPAPITVLSTANGKVEVEIAPLGTPCRAANRELSLRFPEGWSGVLAPDGRVELKHAELPGVLRVGVFSTLDSDAPPRALAKASAASLERFSVVNVREEPRVAPNRAGAMVGFVWRSGTGASGAQRAMNAVGLKADFYWLFTYEWAPGNEETRIRPLLQALAAAMSVEPAG